jgi:glycosyltransferase involved in cell wall biosynthesis
MLSVLIPIFNVDVREFVHALSKLTTQSTFQAEIICLDDRSDDSYRAINQELQHYENVRYLESAVNLGRSAVRNRLEKEARFDRLIFLDCDGKLVHDDYLIKYAQIKDFDVVYGGRVYSAEAPEAAQLTFHWKCGKEREEVQAKVRSTDPYKSFMTNNFMIRRAVYNAIRMDETVQGYGHEDTLFAMEMKRQGFRIKHIDNPLEHIGIEDALVFLEKSANGVRNLALLVKQGRIDESIRLVRFYRMLTNYGIAKPFAALVRTQEARIRQNLTSAQPNLRWFDVWKLARLIEEMKAA